MKQVMIIASLLFWVMSLTAISADFNGQIRNADDSSLITSATIIVESTDKKLTTDLSGKFSIYAENGPIYVTISHVGFVTKHNVPIVLNELNQIYLTPSVTKLNPIVVTARRDEAESFKVSQPVTVFDSEEIQEKGYTTVTSIVQNAPGVDVNDAGSFRARPVVRGVYGSRILVLVDGERLNDHREVVDFAGVSMSLLDVNEIKRVEVLNGPSSVNYGSDAMGGVINILTKNRDFSLTKTPYVNYYSSFSTTDQLSSNRLNFGVNSQKFAFSAGFLYKQANEDYAPPDNWQNQDPRYNVFRPEFYDSLNAARGTSWSKDRLVNSKARVNNYDFGLAYKLSDKHRLDFDAGIFRASDIGYPGVPNDSTPFYFFWPNHDRDNFSVAYSGRGFAGRLAKLDGRFYYQKISKDFFTDFMDGIVIQAGPPPNPPTITPLTSFSSTDVKKLGLNLQGLFQISSKAQVTFGVDSWREAIDGQVTSISHFQGFGPFPFDTTSVTASVPKNQWHALGVFASGQFDFNSVLITAGGRVDNFWLNTDETSGYVDENDLPLPSEDEAYNSVNGSLGLIVPVTKMVNAVANLGTAYRVPNVVERFFYGSASGREVRPNSNIKPERAVSFDFGVKAVNQNIGYSIMGFYSDYTDFTQLQNFAQDPSTSQPLWRYENVENISIYGIETTINGKLNNGLYGGLIFSYQHGNNDTEDEPIFVSPIRTILKLGYRNTQESYFGEINIHRVESQNRVPKVTSLDDIATNSFTVVNTMAGVHLWNYLKLTLNVNNLFDQTYSQSFNGRNPDNPVPEAGRNLILTAAVDVDF